MSKCKKELNDLAASQRALCQGNLAPNHYWDKAANKINKAATIEQMERELKMYGIDSWKWYCHFDPGQSGGGFQLDDDNSMWFYEESRKRGMKLISVHKGFSYQSRTLGHLANPKDVEKAALQNPDFNFVVYHSALKHGPNEANWKESNQYDPTTGDFEWHKILMDIKQRNPKMNNVYCEIGSFFGVLAVADPVMAMHGMGKNIKTYGVKGNKVRLVENFGDPIFIANLKETINGYYYGHTPPMVMKKGERVRWYLFGSTNFEIHAPHWHGNTVVARHMRTDVTTLLPMDMVVADMEPDNVGTWLFHCHTGPHLRAGMVTRYTVEAAAHTTAEAGR